VPGASSGSTLARSRVAIECRLASGAEDLEAHFALRRAVFVREQRLFSADDRDARDEQAATLHAIGLVDGDPCGAVRLYPLGTGGSQWKGDRLAVRSELRTNHLGAALVRFAVSTAGRLGGERMFAHVQLPNVRFFEHLGWRREAAPAPFHGVDHQLMSIDLGQGA
jgi:putative N-acetyltransferase (TIGR04045 family)